MFLQSSVSPASQPCHYLFRWEVRKSADGPQYLQLNLAPCLAKAGVRYISSEEMNEQQKDKFKTHSDLGLELAGMGRRHQLAGGGWTEEVQGTWRVISLLEYTKSPTRSLYGKT